MVESFTASDKKLPVAAGSKSGQTVPPGEEPPATAHRAVRLMRAGAVVSTLSPILTVIGSFSLKRNMTFSRRFPRG